MGAYLINLAVLIAINAILAVTLNFVLGYAGIFSMAHAVFFGEDRYHMVVTPALCVLAACALRPRDGAAPPERGSQEA